MQFCVAGVSVSVGILLFHRLFEFPVQIVSADQFRADLYRLKGDIKAALLVCAPVPLVDDVDHVIHEDHQNRADRYLYPIFRRFQNAEIRTDSERYQKRKDKHYDTERELHNGL